MTRRRSTVERAYSNLPKENAEPADQWQVGYGGVRYLRVGLETDALPHAQPLSETLFLSADGRTTRHVGVSEDEYFADQPRPLDKS